MQQKEDIFVNLKREKPQFHSLDSDKSLTTAYMTDESFSQVLLKLNKSVSPF